MFDNVPEWMPFACLMVKNPVVALRKSMIARIIEACIISMVSAGAAIVIGLPYAIKEVQADLDRQKVLFEEHIKWSGTQVSNRNIQVEKIAETAARDRAEIKNLLNELNRCLRERTCTK